MDQRPDGRSLLSAAPRSEIEVDERWISKWWCDGVAIGRSRNWEIKKLRGSNSGGIDQVRTSQKQGDMKAMSGKESWKKGKKQVQKRKEKIKTDRSRSRQIRDREELASWLWVRHNNLVYRLDFLCIAYVSLILGVLLYVVITTTYICRRMQIVLSYYSKQI